MPTIENDTQYLERFMRELQAENARLRHQNERLRHLADEFKERLLIAQRVYARVAEEARPDGVLPEQL